MVPGMAALITCRLLGRDMNTLGWSWGNGLGPGVKITLDFDNKRRPYVPPTDTRRVSSSFRKWEPVWAYAT